MRGLAGVLALTLVLAMPAVSAGQDGLVRVAVETALGTIEIEVNPRRAPITAANFLRHVDQGLYEGARFHRTVKPGNQPDNRVQIEVIQASPDPARPKQPTIPLERTSVTGLRHVDGAVSMARDETDTAISDFFVCIGDQPELDFGGGRHPDGQGFAAFGRVVSGMEVVRRIQQSPADKQLLAPPVPILRVLRLERIGPADSRRPR